MHDDQHKTIQYYNVKHTIIIEIYHLEENWWHMHIQQHICEKRTGWKKKTGWTERDNGWTESSKKCVESEIDGVVIECY